MGRRRFAGAPRVHVERPRVGAAVCAGRTATGEAGLCRVAGDVRWIAVSRGSSAIDLSPIGVGRGPFSGGEVAGRSERGVSRRYVADPRGAVEH
jgi:hypothetical protein